MKPSSLKPSFTSAARSRPYQWRGGASARFLASLAVAGAALHAGTQAASASPGAVDTLTFNTARTATFRDFAHWTPLASKSKTQGAALRQGFALPAFLLPLLGANTVDNVTGTAANTPLDSAGSYSNGLPGTTSDVIFTSGTAYSGTFTLNSSPLSIGTLDDLNTTALTISASKALTLNGGTNSLGDQLNSVNFVSPNDLFYVAPGGTLTYNGTGGIVLNGTGNFDIASSNFNGTNLNGAATINSIISGSGSALTKTGTGTLTLTAANTYTGATNVVQGNLTLNFAAAGAPTTNIISNLSALTLGGYTTSGGGSLYAPTELGENPTLLVAGAATAAGSTQTFNGLTVNAGTNQLIARGGNAAGNMTVALGAITAAPGGSINFTENTGGSTGTGVITTANTNDASGILGGWAVTNAAAANSANPSVPTDYATVNGSNQIVAYTGYTGLANNAVLTGTTTANTNGQVTATSATALTVNGTNATTDINTLSTKSTSTAATTVTIGTGDTLRFGANGGILTGSTNSAATLTISGGSVTAGGSATANNPGTLNFQLDQKLNISSNIVDNGTGGAVTVVVNAYNSPNSNTSLNLTGTNTFSGGLFINSGRVTASSTGVGTVGAITIGPAGQLYAQGSGTYTNALVLEGSGGGNSNSFYDTPSALRGGTYSGLVTLDGDAGIFQATLNGQVTGAGGLTIGRTNSNSDGGTSILGSGLNNYQGNTIITEQTLKLGANNTIPSANTQATDVGNVIFANSGTGTLNLNGFSTNINGLSSNGIAAGATGPGIVTNGTSGASILTLGYNNATATYNGTVTDSGTGKTLAITKTGTGTQTLGGANTYIGATTVNAGTLALSNNGTLGSTGASAVTVGSAGTLNIAGTGATYVIGSGTQTTGTGAGSVALNTGGGTLSLLSGVINALQINAASGNTGLTLGGSNALSFDLSSATADSISLSAGVLASVTGTNTINLNLLARPTANQTYTLISAPGGGLGSLSNFKLGTFTGTSSFGINFALADTGSLLQLMESVAPTPGTAYFVGNQGTSWAATGGGITNFSSDAAGSSLETQLPGATTNVHFYAQNATLASVAASTLDQATSINSLTVDGATLGESGAVGIASGTGGSASTLTVGTGGITVNSGAGATTISAPVILGAVQTFTNNSANTLTLSGGLTAGANLLTLAGAGATTLSGTNAFTTSAGFTVNSGAGAFTLSAPTTLGAAQTWTNNSSNAVNVSGAVTNGGNTLTLAGTGSDALSGVIGGTGGLTDTDTGTVTLTGANTYTGTTTVSGGHLTFVNNHSGGSSFIDNATLEFNNTAQQQLNGGTLSGTGTLIKSGSGTLLLGANSSVETVAMTGGLIDVQGGLLRNEYGNGNWTNNKASMEVDAGATVDLWDSPGGITVDALTGSGTVTHTSYGNAENFTVGVNNGSGTFSGTITNASSGFNGVPYLNLVKNGTGTQTLTGANTYTGATSISAGTLQLGNGGTTGNLATGSAITDNGTFTINRSNAVTQGTDFSGGAITGTGSFTQAGAGTTTLNAANTYSGTTTVSAGTLALDNTSGSGTGTGTVALSGGSSATLSGKGSAAGLVTVTNGSVLAPGDNASGNTGTAGTLGVGTNGGLTLTNATLDFDLSSLASGANDLLTTGGPLTFGGANSDTFNFNELGGSLQTGTAYTLISGASSTSGFSMADFVTMFTGGPTTYTSTYSLGGSNGNSLLVTFGTPAAAPEPSQFVAFTIGLLGLGGLAMKARRRSRLSAA